MRPRGGGGGRCALVTTVLALVMAGGCASHDRAADPVDTPGPPATVSTAVPPAADGGPPVPRAPEIRAGNKPLGQVRDSRVDGAAVRVPRINVASSLRPVGLNEDGTVQVPPVNQAMQAVWYRHGPVPGEPGPAVILGHVDGNHRQGVFWRLREVNPGDEILVTNPDGRELRFVVYDRARYPKDRFPTDSVYGNTEGPELRLITCGGLFDPGVRGYRDNIVVYARLV